MHFTLESQLHEVSWVCTACQIITDGLQERQKFYSRLKTKESLDKNVFPFDRDFSVFDWDYQWTDRLCDENFLQTNEFLVKDFQRKVVVSIFFGIVTDFQ